jgi:hypothetical protein
MTALSVSVTALSATPGLAQEAEPDGGPALGAALMGGLIGGAIGAAIAGRGHRRPDLADVGAPGIPGLGRKAGLAQMGGASHGRAAHGGAHPAVPRPVAGHPHRHP